MFEPVSLNVFADKALLGLVTSFVSESASAFGLPNREAMCLQLAAEEIFMHIGRFVQSGADVKVTCSPGGYYVRAAFEFTARPFDLGAFNLTTSIRSGDTVDTERLGLFLASKSVDRLYVDRPQPNRVRLNFIKEKPYAEAKPDPDPATAVRLDYAVREPSADEVHLLAGLINTFYSAGQFPKFLRYPAKAADMLLSGQLSSLISVDPGGLLGGGLLWNWSSEKTVEFFGPYLFGSHLSAEVGETLVDTMIQRLGRTNCINLFTMFGTPHLPETYFQSPGYLDMPQEGKSSAKRTVYLRVLQEDPGCMVWAKPPLTGFLERSYRHLHLPRNIVEHSVSALDVGEESVLFADLDRIAGTIELHPVASGKDIGKNIQNHLQLLTGGGIRAVFFNLDLGEGRQTDFIEPLAASGFEPRFIIPLGGKGDRVIYQFKAERP